MPSDACGTLYQAGMVNKDLNRRKKPEDRKEIVHRNDSERLYQLKTKELNLLDLYRMNARYRRKTIMGIFVCFIFLTQLC